MTRGTEPGLGARVMLLLLALQMMGCPSGTGEGLDVNGRPLDEGGGVPPVAPAASFESIQANVLTPVCTVCHAGAAAPVGLKLDALNSYEQLVGVASQQVPSVQRVAPGDPDNSYLIQKIEGTAGVGQQMPLGGPFLSTDEVDRIRAWISAGALPPAPPAPDVPPVVLSVVPAAGQNLTARPDAIVIVFSKPMDTALISATTIELRANGTLITPTSLALTGGDDSTLRIDLTSVALDDGAYQLTLVGNGATVLADTDGLALDGDGDGTAGDDFESTFTLNTAAPPPEATWRSIQDNVFTLECVVCHVDGGQASFLPLDEDNSYDALIGVPSIEVSELLRVAPLDADASYLVQKLEGTAAVGARMPLGGEPLPETSIAAVRNWIDAGAVRMPGDPVPDVVLPAVVIAAPLGELRGTVTLVANASDASGVAGVDFYVDDDLLSRDTTEPYEATFDTTLVSDGTHTLLAFAQDTAGNEGQSDALAVVINNAPPPDVEPPSVALQAPASPLAGVVTLSAVALDNIGVVEVRFYLDDALLATSEAAPYEITFDTTTRVDGVYILRAEAEDEAGNVGISAQVITTIDNVPPGDVTAPIVSLNDPGSPLSGTVILSATASDDVAVVDVTLLIDGVDFASDTDAPYSFEVDTTTLSAGTHTLQVRARDAAGNTGVSAIFEIEVDNVDRLAPDVAIMAPADPAIGTITVQVTASDAEGVNSVTLLINGVALGSDAVAPYEFIFDTTSVGDGPHVLEAQATDGAGNTGAAVPLLLSIENGGPQPTLAWIQEEVFDVGCAAGCHVTGGIAPFLRLDAPNAFAELVNVATSQGGPPLRVAPGDPDQSALVQRLEGTLAPSMPLGGAPLPQDQIDAVRAWIASGADETPADVIAPGVAFTAPSSPVTGSVIIAAFAVDNVAVTTVRLLVDDTEVATATDTPYLLTWDSAGSTDGDHSLRVEALDAAGNVATSLTVTVATQNGTTPILNNTYEEAL